MSSTVILPLGIAATVLCSFASGLFLCTCRDPEILALWILAEVALNRADFYRNTFIELVWSFEQRNPPNRFYLAGGQMLRSFQHVKRSARNFSPYLSSLPSEGFLSLPSQCQHTHETQIEKEDGGGFGDGWGCRRRARTRDFPRTLVVYPASGYVPRTVIVLVGLGHVGLNYVGERARIARNRRASAQAVIVFTLSTAFSALSAVTRRTEKRDREVPRSLKTCGVAFLNQRLM
jgi:hypothetical protein